MKYVVVLGDGMADYPVAELNNKTPLEAANKPNIDGLAEKGELGLVKTVPDHLNPPGSDIANMSEMGYDPDVFYTGRSPLEAVSMGLTLGEEDLAVRCNLVTLSDEPAYEDKTMIDYSSDEISTSESTELINYVQEKLGTDILHLYPGISYRHCLVYKIPGEVKLLCTPPHDISDKPIKDFLPKAPESAILLEMMKKSHELLKDHPVNKARIAAGKRPANSLWFWGEGRKPALANFKETYGVKGAVVSAVDLIKGLGYCAGMEVIEVPDVTGNINTNFTGKMQATVDFLKNGGDFVYLHMEAPDECGHRHEIDNKVKSIEIIDRDVVGPIVGALKGTDDFKLLILPDHPTPLALRTHTHDAVPYLIYDSRKGSEKKGQRYTESCAEATKNYRSRGHELMRYFLEG